jgi:hypothetical protein
MKRRSIKQRDGQFIIIAVLFIATMIISMGSILYTTSTYYKFEPWEEYLTLIGNIELSSWRLVELSLSNFTHTNNTNILSNNLQQWQSDLTKIYPGYGIELKYSLADNQGIDYVWNETSSFSSANATFNLNMTSLGLEGYEFVSISSLNVNILNTTGNSINMTVTKENQEPVVNLGEDNFQVEGYVVSNVTSFFDSTHGFVYTINCSEEVIIPVTVSVIDNRGIKVIAQYI